MHRCGASLLLCLALANAGTGFQENRARAEFYLRRHELAAAIPYLERARRIDPSNYDNAYDLALAYLETGNTRSSREVVAGLLAGGNRAELHNLLGDIEEAEGHIEKAAAEYEAAARLDPSEKNLFDLGSDLLRHRGFEPALKVFLFGTGRYPTSARLRVGLGISYYSLGRYDDAVEALCRAVDLDPKDTKALGFLGRMYDVAPALDGKVTARLSRFVRLYPDNAAANYYYALSLRRGSRSGTSNGADAEALLLKAVELQPGFAEAHLELGLLYEDKKMDGKAIREYETAARLKPDLSKAHYRLARLYRKTGQPARAQKEFQAFEALKAKP